MFAISRLISKQTVMKIGINALAFYIPSCYLPIEVLAEKRNIDPNKLKAGLGLYKMAIPLKGEDAATMAAEALWKLLKSENLHPSDISRIYLGTESALDGAKPTMTYAIDMVEKAGEHEWGKRSFKNCDVVDLTFACIGATDALQNCVDYIKLHPNEKAIVIASDIAKYDLNSSGEYTQGAGAVAALITANPQIIALDSEWGVGMQSVHDFFKPKRKISKTTLASQFNASLSEENPTMFGIDETELDFTKESPMFDSQYSNQCYTDRMLEAYEHFVKKNSENPLAIDEWAGIIFHLPYAYHGKRVFVDLLVHEYLKNGKVKTLEEAMSESYPEDSTAQKDFIKRFAKSDFYKNILNEKLEPGCKASSEIGNMYTASVFMSLLSHLYFEAKNNKLLAGKRIGFIAYGSGSKSKVFTGLISDNWKNAILKTELDKNLNNRKALRFEEYETIHRKEKSAFEKADGFILESIETQKENYIGARNYVFKTE